METFTLISYPTLVFRVIRRYTIGDGPHATHCVVGVTLDGLRQTHARVADVIFGGARL